MPAFVLCARNVNADGSFGDDVGPSHYLSVPDGETPNVSMAIDQASWAKAVLAASVHPDGGGDILVFVHGYNNSQADVLQRHGLLTAGLASHGFVGVLVSFDWPCGTTALGYLSDRSKAKTTAMILVDGGISLLAAKQQPDCTVNVHLAAHSTGAYVIREAFDDADDRKFDNGAWWVSQICLLSGDVSSASMAAANAKSDSVYGHCQRLTNYENSHDEVLGLSNLKRAGVRPRVGRVGLPDGSPDSAVNVDCSDHYQNLQPAAPQKKDLVYSHSWQFTDDTFMADLASVINGVDRSSMTTRTTLSENRYLLK